MQISSALYHKTKYYFSEAQGLNNCEILSDSITYRFLKLMKRHPYYFMRLLCYYYPFTREMLRKHQRYLWWDCLSENLFLDWDEGLLTEFKERWYWRSIGEFILGVKGKLANVDFLLKYYEMGLIDAEAILWNGLINAYYDDDRAFSNMDAFCEEFEDIAQLMSMNENLDAEMKELVMERVERNNNRMIYTDSLPTISNTPKRIDSLVKSEHEQLKAYRNKYQPQELEQIISFLESEIINDVGDWYARTPNPDPFMLENPLRNGIDYTFNTPDKRKILDDAVQMFLEGHPALTQIEERIENI